MDGEVLPKERGRLFPCPLRTPPKSTTCQAVLSVLRCIREPHGGSTHPLEASLLAEESGNKRVVQVAVVPWR